MNGHQKESTGVTYEYVNEYDQNGKILGEQWVFRRWDGIGKEKKTILVFTDISELFTDSYNGEVIFNGIRVKMKDNLLYFNTEDLVKQGIVEPTN